MQIDRAESLSLIESRNQQESAVHERKNREIQRELKQARQNFDLHRQQADQMQKQIQTTLKSRPQQHNLAGILARSNNTLRKQERRMQDCQSHLGELKDSLRESADKFTLVNRRLEKLAEIKQGFDRIKKSRLEEKLSDQHVSIQSSRRIKESSARKKSTVPEFVNSAENDLRAIPSQQKAIHKKRYDSSSERSEGKPSAKARIHQKNPEGEGVQPEVLRLLQDLPALHENRRLSTGDKNNTASRISPNTDAVFKREIDFSTNERGLDLSESQLQNSAAVAAHGSPGFINPEHFAELPGLCDSSAALSTERHSQESFQDLQSWKRGTRQGLSLSYETARGRKLRLFLQKGQSSGIEVRIIQLDSGAGNSIRASERQEVENALRAAGLQLQSLHFEHSSGVKRWQKFIQPGC